MSVQRCMIETTSTEFVDWLKFRELRMNKPDRSDYYLAQVAAEIRRSVAKNPRLIKLEHFLLKFVKQQKDKPLTEEQVKQKTAFSKAFWLGLLKKPRKPPEGSK